MNLPCAKKLGEILSGSTWGGGLGLLTVHCQYSFLRQRGTGSHDHLTNLIKERLRREEWQLVISEGGASLRRISLKYAGICVKCGRRIPEGETAYWEKGKGVWHLDCDKFTSRETQLAAAGTRGYYRAFGKQARSRTFGKWKLTPLRASYVRILLVLSIACFVAGLGSVGYASRMGPLVISQSTTRTNTVCVPQTVTTHTYTTFLTTTATVTYVSTFATSRVSTLGYSGPGCPYGGEYRSEICTSLCGCQHDVCVSFDYNCANDYPAVHSARTVAVATRVTAAGTSYMQQTRTQTLDMTRSSTECGTATQTEATSIAVPNPSKGSFSRLGLLLIAIGALGFSYGIWSKQKKNR